jgi:hypothetical protein
MVNMVSNVSKNMITKEDDYTFTASTKANRIKFGVLLFFQFLSIPCFLYLFYQFHQKRQLGQSYRHRVIVLLLMVSFLFVTIALPLTEAYMYTSYVYPASQTFCSLWTWLHYSLNIINLFLMAFASIERNWLIFHSWLVGSKRGKILFHYFPLAFCVLYPPMFYMGVIFIYQCEYVYDYTQLLCKWPCYFNNTNWATIDVLFNNCAPLFAIPVFCSIIYVRIFLQKRSMRQQAFKWRRDRKMILQLWAISSLYLAMWMPLQLVVLINLYVNPNFLIQAQIDYMYLFPYFIHLIYPFIVLFTYHREMLNFKQQTTTVRPFTIQDRI